MAMYKKIRREKSITRKHTRQFWTKVFLSRVRLIPTELDKKGGSRRIKQKATA